MQDQPLETPRPASGREPRAERRVHTRRGRSSRVRGGDVGVVPGLHRNEWDVGGVPVVLVVDGWGGEFVAVFDVAELFVFDGVEDDAVVGEEAEVVVEEGGAGGVRIQLPDALLQGDEFLAEGGVVN